MVHTHQHVRRPIIGTGQIWLSHGKAERTCVTKGFYNHQLDVLVWEGLSAHSGKIEAATSIDGEIRDKLENSNVIGITHSHPSTKINGIVFGHSLDPIEIAHWLPKFCIYYLPFLLPWHLLLCLLQTPATLKKPAVKLGRSMRKYHRITNGGAYYFKINITETCNICIAYSDFLCTRIDGSANRQNQGLFATMQPVFCVYFG